MSKRGWNFQKPLMNAAGTLGFAPDARLPLPWGDFGAFVTNPLSLRPRRPAAEPELIRYPGGFLLHSGLPNPGFSQTLKKYAARWARASLPIIVHLMADQAEETRRMTHRLESLENVMAVELGFSPELGDDLILRAIEMSAGELPVIVNLPWERVLRLSRQALAAGAVAVSLAAPRGALAAVNGGLVAGRLFGPALFAQSILRVCEAVRDRIPLIGSGGLYSQENVDTMLTAGALAVQVDAVLWRGCFSST